MTAPLTRNEEALIIWDWVKYRLPPNLFLEALQELHSGPVPVIQDPQLAAGLAQLTNPQTPNTTRLSLLRQLVTIIRDSGLEAKP
jgi:hypothetical protein